MPVFHQEIGSSIHIKLEEVQPKLKVKCVMCDKINDIEDFSTLAKRLRNRPIHTYMCDSCKARIEKRTIERKATGLFYTPHQKEKSDWP